jgi:hypothetical protein
MPLRAAELKQALDTAPSLTGFHSWVRVDMHDYRIAPGRLRLRRIERLLARLDGRLAAHRSGTERLLATRWAAPGSADAPLQPLFRVPLLVQDRDAAIAALARARITVGYLYDPPLDTYAGEPFTEPSVSPANAAWFARHALPVDPVRAEQVISVLTAAGTEPASGQPR